MPRYCEHITNKSSCCSKYFSIRWILFISHFLSLAVVPTILIVIFHFYSYLGAEEVQHNFIQQVQKTVEEHLDEFMTTQVNVAESITNQYDLGILFDPQNPSELRANLFARFKAKSLKKITVHAQFEDGTQVGYAHLPHQDPLLIQTLPTTPITRGIYTFDPDTGAPVNLTRTDSIGPANYVWFETTISAGVPIWTPYFVSTLFDSSLGFTYSVPVFDRDNSSKVLFVLTTIRYFDEMSEYLQTSVSDPNKQILFLLNDKQQILSTSLDIPYTRHRAGTQIDEAYPASEFPNKFVSQCAAEVVKRSLDIKFGADPLIFEYTSPRDKIMASAGRVGDESMGWTFVHCSEHSLYFSTIQRGRDIALYVSVAIASFSLLFSTLLNTQIVSPIIYLANRMQKLAMLQLGPANAMSSPRADQRRPSIFSQFIDNNVPSTWTTPNFLKVFGKKRDANNPRFEPPTHADAPSSSPMFTEFSFPPKQNSESVESFTEKCSPANSARNSSEMDVTSCYDSQCRCKDHRRPFLKRLVSPKNSKFFEIKALHEAFTTLSMTVRSFSLYVPSDVVRELLEDDQLARPCLTAREITCLFTDIANFTAISERIPTHILVHLLSEYFDILTGAIHAKGGTVDKYIGDAVMAIWNAPRDVPDHPQRACEAALRIQRHLKIFNEKCANQGLPELHTRIGIAMGPALVGTFGSSVRLSYTALGDTVNLSSRLEGLNKHYGTQIIISGKIFDYLREKDVEAHFSCRYLGTETVRGKSEPIRIYEIPVDPDKSRASSSHTLEGHVSFVPGQVVPFSPPVQVQSSAPRLSVVLAEHLAEMQATADLAASRAEKSVDIESGAESTEPSQRHSVGTPPVPANSPTEMKIWTE